MIIHFEVIDDFGNTVNHFFHKMNTLPNENTIISYGNKKYKVLSVLLDLNINSNKLYKTQTIIKVKNVL